jgi:hypothetical protein
MMQVDDQLHNAAAAGPWLEEDPLMQKYGLRLNNSRRDIERARQCRYGLTAEKRGVTAATPVDYRLYPNRPRDSSELRTKPLLATERGFVRTNAAQTSFPACRQEEINASLAERRQSRSAVLTKAIEELRYQDRNLLVNVPWYYSNHKNAQSGFLGGGNCDVARPEFLLKTATDSPYVPGAEEGGDGTGAVVGEGEQQPQGY